MRKKKEDTLKELLESVSLEEIMKFIRIYAEDDPKFRLDCFDSPVLRAKAFEELKRKCEGEAILCLWDMLLSDLEDMDDEEYSGCAAKKFDENIRNFTFKDQHYEDFPDEEDDWEYLNEDFDELDEDVNHVSDLLDDIARHLKAGGVDKFYRFQIIDNALPFLECRIPYIHNLLIKVIYAACKEKSDYRYIAEKFEAIGEGNFKKMARNIYRQTGYNDKYVKLRMKELRDVDDYLELAEFFYESGKINKAGEIANKGLKKGFGDKGKLTDFIENKLEKSGKGKTLQNSDSSSEESMTLLDFLDAEFENSAEEDNNRNSEQAIEKNDAQIYYLLKTLLKNKEYEKAMDILADLPDLKEKIADRGFLEITSELEKFFPKKILKWYRERMIFSTKGIDREAYKVKACIMQKIHYLTVVVLNDEKKWWRYSEEFKLKYKKNKMLQEEFEKMVPGWNSN